MHPLRDLEEARVAFDHDPTGVHAGAARVREQRLQQLGDAATGRGRVHVQDRTALRAGAAAAAVVSELFGALGTEHRPSRPGAIARTSTRPQRHVDQHSPFGTHYESPIDIMLAEGTLRTDDDRRPRAPHSIPMPGTHPAHRPTQR